MTMRSTLHALVPLLCTGLLTACPKTDDAPVAPAASSQPAAAPASQPAAGAALTPPKGGVVVGTGQAGFADAPAQFSKPIRLAAFGPGQVVVADIGNHAVRLVDKNGKVKTLAGGPDKMGHKDGPAAEALLNGPHGVAVQKDGAIVVAEASNHCLRLLTPDKNGGYVVSTLAGTPGQAGFADGASGTAKFSAPHGILLEADGSILVADIGNGRLRRVKDGTVTTLAGTGTPGKADGPDGTLHMPMDLARAGDGTVLIADAGAQILRGYSSKGLSTPKVAQPFNMPHGVAQAPDGTLVVAELYGHQVVAIDQAGQRRVVLGSGKPGAGGQNLNKPAAVLVHDGLLWIADLDNHQVKAVPWPPAS